MAISEFMKNKTRESAVTVLGRSEREPVRVHGFVVERVGGIVHVAGIPCITYRAALEEIQRRMVAS